MNAVAARPPTGYVMPVPARNDRTDDVFVGRTAELALLRAHAEHARSGRPRIVLVEGPAGIGKTTLVRRFFDQDAPEHVLWAAGEHTEQALSFEVLRRLVGGTPVPGALAAPLGLLGSVDPGEPVDAFTLGGAFLDLLGELQRNGPVAVVIDDARWVDAESLNACVFALRRLGRDQVMAVLITRDGADPYLHEGLRRLLATQDVQRLALAGMDAGDLVEFSGRLCDRELSAGAAQRLGSHTAGNPLHARALLEQVPVKELCDLSAPLPAPRSYAMLVLASLAGCSPEAQRLVEAAGVLGQSCPLDSAARLAGVAAPLGPLEEATSRGLLRERPTTAGLAIAFCHPLDRAAVYRDLGPARRALLHRKAADLSVNGLEALRHRSRAALGPDTALSEELAGHARGHAKRGSWAVAGELFTLSAGLSGTPGGRARRTVDAFEALMLAGQTEEARSLSAALSRAEAPATCDYVHGHIAAVDGRLPEAAALLGEAWQLCDQGRDPHLAARIAEQLARLCALEGKGAETALWAERAAHPRPEHAGSDLTHFLRVIGLASSGAVPAALAHQDGLPDPAVATFRELDALLGHAAVRLWTDDLERARRDLLGIWDAGRERSAQFRGLAGWLLAQAEFRLGRWDDALVHGETAVSIADGTAQAWLTPMAYAMAALVPTCRGDWDHARAHLDAAVDHAGRVGSATALGYAAYTSAHLAAGRNDHEGVIAALRPFLDLEPTRAPYEPGILPWQDLLIDALVAAGDDAQAEELLESFAGRAVACGRHSALAAAARCRGNLHAARREPGPAESAFQEGLRQIARVDLPFEEARLRLSYGRFLRRCGKRGQAAAQLGAARSVLAALGARPLLRLCDQELAACGRQPAGGRDEPARLTPQELAVSRLVATGLTNRQVARELVLSVKTVEYHLGHVYAKTGVTSRTALAAALARTGPP
ncbi:AAA family ATPase [Spirillospora sp. NPDC047279]|uniref:ATP-binding protein n=1 Tax=Spirillospora sp. NPDC047279 TaxID=3155478 RepID=UPI0033EAFA3B